MCIRDRFTCRRLVKVAHPAVTVINQLRRQTGMPDLGREVERHYPKQLRFTFPFEIQITDWENYLASRQGESSHISYKRRQLAAARRRILGGVLLEEARKLRVGKTRSRGVFNLQKVDPDATLDGPTASSEEVIPPLV